MDWCMYRIPSTPYSPPLLLPRRTNFVNLDSASLLPPPPRGHGHTAWSEPAATIPVSTRTCHYLARPVSLVERRVITSGIQDLGIPQWVIWRHKFYCNMPALPRDMDWPNPPILLRYFYVHTISYIYCCSCYFVATFHWFASYMNHIVYNLSRTN